MLEKKSEFTIYPIPVLQDNIVWVWVHNCNAVVVDPSISDPVEKWLLDKKLSLEAIFQTHHHDDHIGGTQKLIKRWPDAKVIASKNELTRIPFQTFSVENTWFTGGIMNDAAAGYTNNGLYQTTGMSFSPMGSEMSSSEDLSDLKRLNYNDLSTQIINQFSSDFISKGDLLTTCGTHPGCAQKAITPVLGSIVGKAMENSDSSGESVILISVGRL